MAKHTLKILQCSHRKIFKVSLAILQHYAWKGEKQLVIKNDDDLIVRYSNKIQMLSASKYMFKVNN